MFPVVISDPLSVVTTGYTYQRGIWLPQKSGASAIINNYPLNINEVIPDLKTVGNGGLLQNASGYDLQFFDQFGQELYQHTFNYVATTGRIRKTVNLPVYSLASGQLFYIAYGKTGVTVSPDNDAQAFRAYGAFVRPDTGHDFTVNANDFTMTNVTAGILLNAAAGVFASNSYGTPASSAWLQGVTALAIEFVFQQAAANVDGQILQAANNNFQLVAVTSNNGAVNTYVAKLTVNTGGITHTARITMPSGLQDTNVHHVGVYWESGNDLQFYFDGAFITPDSEVNQGYAGFFDLAGSKLYIGPGGGVGTSLAMTMINLGFLLSTVNPDYFYVRSLDAINAVEAYGLGDQEDPTDVLTSSVIAAPNYMPTPENTPASVDVVGISFVPRVVPTPTVSVDTSPGNGTAALQPDGRTIKYTPTTNFVGDDGGFQYSLTATNGKVSSRKIYPTVFSGNPVASGGSPSPVVSPPPVGNYRSGLPWASGFDPQNWNEPLFRAWEKYRQRRVDLWQSHHNSDNLANILSRLQDKASLYQGAYDFGVCISQVFDFCPKNLTSTQPQVFKDVASGKYDSTIIACAQTLNGYKRHAPYVLRVCHEANATAGGAWSHDTSPTKANFKAAYQHVIGILRKYIKNPAPLIELNTIYGAGDEVENAYPGNAYVDIIGVDLYCNGGQNSYLPYSSAADFDRFSQDTFPNGGPHGMEAWCLYAKSKGKQCSVAEWAPTDYLASASDTNSPDQHDDPWYIDGMYRVFQKYATTAISATDPRPVFLYEAYFWGIDAAGHDHRINNPENNNPRCTLKYKQKWTNPKFVPSP